MTVVQVVVPEGIDDPQRPSGGNAYDRRICHQLRASGWSVCEHHIAGTWPDPDARALGRLAAVIAELPNGSTLLVDGLIASAAADVVAPQALRHRIVILMHLPLGCAADASPEVLHREKAVVHAVEAVVTTSAWTRGWLIDAYGLHPSRVHVAAPGVDAASVADGTHTGGVLLCVAAITRDKGHDCVLAALALVTDLPWQLSCVGATDRDPQFMERLTAQIARDGITDRVHFTGPRTPGEVAQDYARADLLVVGSRIETYGMVVTEALARGLPVLATNVGGIPEAMGRTSDGVVPGLLAPRDDPPATAALLRRWLTEEPLRASLRTAAQERRATLEGWSATSDRIAAVLSPVAA